ncbi:hypothetical protein [Flavobacterium sp. 3HN19-14]|uniref:hypothetical protein n=1 Tax=Flavobacterium sp. 3HN19-14 TaxID=3448133 RepID=UPI003EE13B5C
MNSTLEITGSDITSLEGLSQLSGGAILYIHDVPNLLSYAGLNNLTSLYSLRISGQVPSPIFGFSSLQHIESSLTITNSDVSSIQGFVALADVGYTVQITSNQYLTDISAFNFLFSIGAGQDVPTDGLIISNNPMLESVPGFEVLHTINGAINVSNTLCPICIFLTALQVAAGLQLLEIKFFKTLII